MADKRDAKADADENPHPQQTFAEMRASEDAREPQLAERTAEAQVDLLKAADKADLPAMDWPAPVPVDPSTGTPVRRYRPNALRCEPQPKEDELTAEEKRAGGPVYIVETDQWGHDETGTALFKGDLFQKDDLNAKTHDLPWAIRTGVVRRAPEHIQTYRSQKEPAKT